MFRSIAVCAAALVWCVPALAADPENGIYLSKAEGQGTKVKRNDGAEVVLGARVSGTFGKATLRSVANDNSRFVLELRGAGPLPADADRNALALVIDSVCLGVYSHSDPHRDGTIDLGAAVEGEAAAEKVAKVLKAQVEKRTNPGHRLEVRWTPEKDQFQAGDPVTVRMEIKNVGDKPVAFFVGGKQRGARDNQYRFLAHRSHGLGKAVPDTGDPTNFGGKGGVRILKPGEKYTAAVDLTKWFDFPDADTYRITGIFELELYDAANAGPREIWNDLAVGECSVKIVPKR